MKKIIFGQKPTDSQSKKNSSIASNLFSPKNENYQTIDSGDIPISIKNSKCKKNFSIKKYKFKSPEQRNKEIILEKKEEDDDYNIGKEYYIKNDKYIFNNQNIFETINIDIESKKKRNSNNVVKFPRIKNKNSNDLLITDENDEKTEKQNLKNYYLSSRKMKQKNKKKEQKEKFKNNEINNSFKNVKKTFSSKSVIIVTNNEDKKTEPVLNKIKKYKKNKNIGNMRLHHKKVNYAYTDEELRDMNFEEAMHNDNRTFFRIYIAILKEEHIILNTFLTDVYLELRSIKLSFLVFSFEISFFLNAVFYTDEYISQAYHNDGVLDFFSSLPKSLYSFIVTLVVSNLLKMLSNSKKQLMKIIKDIDYKQKYLELMDAELYKLKKKLAIYYVIVFLLGLFFFYYISAFCAVYSNSQKYWFYGCLESFGLDLATPFAICLALTSLRYLGLKKHTKCLYSTAGFLGNIL